MGALGANGFKYCIADSPAAVAPAEGSGGDRWTEWNQIIERWNQAPSFPNTGGRGTRSGYRIIFESNAELTRDPQLLHKLGDDGLGPDLIFVAVTVSRNQILSRLA